jgi:hypothetical protein
MSLTFTINGCDSGLKTLVPPLEGLIFNCLVFPGFRFASPWANFWSHLRRSVYRSVNDYEKSHSSGRNARSLHAPVASRWERLGMTIFSNTLMRPKVNDILG